MLWFYKTRRFWALIILLILLPVYVVFVITLINGFARLTPMLELLLYAVLGIVWVFPCYHIFKGIGQTPPKE